MAVKKDVQDTDNNHVVVKAKDFWEKNSKPLMIVSALIIIAVAGWYGYREFVKKPKESKAAEAVFRAEEYFRMDSVNLALNGDGQNWGFLRVIDKYGGTKAGNMARFYAGSCYIKLNDNEKAIRHLEKFSSDSKMIQARAYKLLGDAYADQGKNADALSNYKKAGHHFEDDDQNSPEYLYLAAYFADRVMKDRDEAIALYKEIRDKYPTSQKATDADNNLAQLGVYSDN